VIQSCINIVIINHSRPIDQRDNQSIDNNYCNYPSIGLQHSQDLICFLSNTVMNKDSHDAHFITKESPRNLYRSKINM